MIVSYNWLKELVDIPYSPDELSLALTSQGMTVDGVEEIGFTYNNIVVGEIVEIKDHPDADKLSVLQVNVGAEPLQIVCGAPGLEVGQKVPVALIGAVLDDFKIKKSKLRGVESYGMCCGADELGISDDHTSLFFLDPETKVGTPFEEIVTGKDHLFDLDIPGNRPDLLSHIGVAREIHAHFAFKSGDLSKAPLLVESEDLEIPNADLTPEYSDEIIEQVYTAPAPPWMQIGFVGLTSEIISDNFEINESDKVVQDFVQVEVLATDLCPKYTARVIENVYTAPAPPWMQARLHRLGMRPINNIVDITNYVMLEYGQPLHAFDYQKVKDGKIVVRRAENGEKLTTLDDSEHILNEDILVIADDENALALAGVMGGASSAVTDKTITILLESANFNGPNIRKTSRKLNLQSESSFRFERTVQGVADAASLRAAELLCKYAGGSVMQSVVDVDNGEGAIEVEVDYAKCTGLLGVNLEKDQSLLALKSLGYKITEKGDDFSVTVPGYRVDVSVSADISEELARMIGYDKIPMNTEINFRSTKPLSEILILRNKIKDILSGIGMREAYNPSLISTDLLKAAGISEDSAEMQAVTLSNAANKDQSVMRTLLYPGLIRNAQHNFSHQSSAVMLFEIGCKYLAPESGRDYQEPEMLSFILAGNLEEASWCSKAHQADFYDGSTVLQHLLSSLGLDGLESAAFKFDGCHPGRTAKLSLAGQELGLLAELDPRLIRELDLPGRVVVAEIEISKLLSNQVLKFKTLPKYPTSTRDIAMFVNNKHSHQEIKEVVLSAKIDKLESVDVFDLYQGEQVPDGYKSMAYRIVYRDPVETLTDEIVDKLHSQLLKELSDKLDINIR